MWSVRAVVESVVEHGKRALRRRRHHRLHHPYRNPQQSAAPKLSKGAREGAGEAAEGCGVGRAALVAGRLRPLTTQLVQGILRRVSAPLLAEARRRTTQRLVFGASAPYFALVGVTLVGGSQGLVTRDDELEALCGNVREAISRAGWLHNPEFWQPQREDLQQQQQQQEEEEEEEEGEEAAVKGEHAYSLADFTLGHVIDKGCNAVVYAARWNTDESQDEDVSSCPTAQQGSVSPLRSSGKREEVESCTPAISEVVQDLPHTSQEAVGVCEAASLTPEDPAPSMSLLHSSQHILTNGITLHSSQHTLTNGITLSDAEEEEEQISVVGDWSSQGAVARAHATPATPIPKHPQNVTFENHQGEGLQEEAACEEKQEFPLAIKMMFNYEAESNAPAILRAMYKEILPARSVQLDQAQQEWQERICGPRVCLPHHPNVVEMPCVFVDRVPLLEGCLELYPHALPTRLNPQGYGRNMSLFCVMKRYDTSLREYLTRHCPPHHTSLLLLTQLLEALLHLSNHNTAHRDLKSDNILLSLAEGWQYPLLVLTDFGCSLACDSPSLTVPFPSREADPRLGNPALMAPEVKAAVPGLLRSISYSQSDLWAAGALAYEMYGLENPFCLPAAAAAATSHKRRPKHLDSATYKESQLPRLPRSVPPWVRHLVMDLLRRNPRQRPSVSVAATLCQLMLWAPSKWLSRHSLSLPTHTEVTQWLLCLATKVLCEARLPHSKTQDKQERKKRAGHEGNADHQGSQLEYQLVSTFLARVHYVDIIQAIKWNRAF